MKADKGSSFIKNIVNVGIGTIINMIIGFLSTPIITRIVDPQEYGRQSIFTLYCSIAVMVACLGLDQTLVRYYYRKKTIEYRRGILFKCAFPPLLIVSVLGLTFLVLNFFGIVQFEFSDMPLLFVLAILGELMFRFSSLELRLENDGTKYAIASVIHKAVYVIVAISLIYLTNNHTFFYLAVAFVVSYIVSCVYCISAEKSVWHFSNGHECDVRFSELARYGFPFVLSMGLTTLFNAIDKLSLKALCDYKIVGLYASATTLIGVFTIVQTSFNAMWAPTSVKHYEENPNDTEFYSKINGIISYILFAFGLTFICFKDVFGLLLGSSYREAAQILPFLSLQPIMYTISETTVTGAVVNKKSYVHLITAGVSCIVNLIGNMILIPFIGARGAAISTGLSYIVFYALRTGFGNAYYKFEHRPLKFWTSTVIVIVNALYNTFISNFVISLILFICSMAIIGLMYKEVLFTIKIYALEKLKSIKQ